MKSLPYLILTLLVCSFVALAMWLSMFRIVPQILDESPASRQIAPNPAQKIPAPTKDWPIEKGTNPKG